MTEPAERKCPANSGNNSVGSYPEELTDDQIAYLHEQAEKRRAIWREHAALTAGEQPK